MWNNCSRSSWGDYEFYYKREGDYNSKSRNYRIEELDDKYIFEVLSPSVDKKDIELKYQDDTLLITIDIEELDNEDKQFYGIKSKYRIRNFPKNINSAKISAEMIKGVLTITMPKNDEDKTKNIEIT